MNIKETKRCLKTFPTEESMVLVSNHGYGKSQVVAQVAKELGIPMIDLRLPQNDVGDLKGMPFHVNGRTVFAPPEFMPITKEDADKIKELLNLTEEISLGRYGDEGILLLDEANRATKEVLNVAFELILDRRLNFRSLPPGWRVVLCVNGSSIYDVNTFCPALLSRLFVIDFEPSYEEWMEHAQKNNFHPAVIEFIRRHPELLDATELYIEECSIEGIKKVHDRRAWEKLSNTILKMEDDFKKGMGPNPLAKTPSDLSFLNLTANGFVGILAGTKFRSFIETNYEALNADIILNHFDNKVEAQLLKVINNDRIPELASYNEAIIDYLKNKEVEVLSKKQGKNLTSYVKIIPKEVRGDLWDELNSALPDLSEAWYNTSDENSDLILEALANPNATKKEMLPA